MSPFYGVRLKKARPTHVSTAYLGLCGPPCKGGGNGRSAERRTESFAERASPSPSAVVDADCGIYTKLVANARGSACHREERHRLERLEPCGFHRSGRPDRSVSVLA